MTLLLAVLLAASASPDLDARRKQLKDLIDEQWEYNLKDSPEFASVIGDKRYNDRLSDRSEKHVFENIERDKVMLARFSAIDTTGFPEQEALNKSLIVRDLQLDVESVRFKDWEQPVSQFSGIHINAPQLVTVLSSRRSRITRTTSRASRRCRKRSTRPSRSCAAASKTG